MLSKNIQLLKKKTNFFLFCFFVVVVFFFVVFVFRKVRFRSRRYTELPLRIKSEERTRS